MLKQLVQNEVQRLLNEGLSGAKIAKKAGVSDAYISNIKNNDIKHIADAKWREMAKKLGVTTASWLLYETKSKKSVFAVCEEAQNN